jgi:hypothetical protein
MLWVIGYIIFLMGIVGLSYGFLKECDTVSCQIDGLVWQSGGMFVSFLGSVLVVIGYSYRAKNENKRLSSLDKLNEID